MKRICEIVCLGKTSFKLELEVQRQYYGKSRDEYLEKGHVLSAERLGVSSPSGAGEAIPIVF